MPRQAALAALAEATVTRRLSWLLVAAVQFAGVACAPAPQTVSPARTQIAHLNHFFATVDALTAQEIERSAFLRRFANLEIRTTTGTQSTWTGRYLDGRETYAEFFGPGDFQIDGKAAPPGSWGIALSGDRPGDALKIRSRIEGAGHKAIVEVDTRTFGERAVPWFTAVTAVSKHGDSGGRSDAVSVWVMEYVPSYLDLPEVRKEPAEGLDDTVSRERYQSDLYRERMMRDVTLVEFDVSPQDFERVRPLLHAAGFRMSRAGDRATADGEQTDFVFNVRAEARGLRRVEFSLNAPVPARVEAIGRSTLRIGPGAAATWVFD